MQHYVKNLKKKKSLKIRDSQVRNDVNSSNNQIRNIHYRIGNQHLCHVIFTCITPAFPFDPFFTLLFRKSLNCFNHCVNHHHKFSLNYINIISVLSSVYPSIYYTAK